MILCSFFFSVHSAVGSSGGGSIRSLRSSIFGRLALPLVCSDRVRESDSKKSDERRHRDTDGSKQRQILVSSGKSCVESACLFLRKTLGFYSAHRIDAATAGRDNHHQSNIFRAGRKRRQTPIIRGSRRRAPK